MNTDDQGRELEDSVLSVNNTKCPQCGSDQFELRNYSAIWHEGDIYCAKCGRFLRCFDAG